MRKNQFEANYSLEILILSENKMKALSYSIFASLSKIRGIYLHKNELETLPDQLPKNNFELEEIDVRRNKLAEISINFSKLNSIYCILVLCFCFT